MVIILSFMHSLIFNLGWGGFKKNNLAKKYDLLIEFSYAGNEDREGEIRIRLCAILNLNQKCHSVLEKKSLAKNFPHLNIIEYNRINHPLHTLFRMTSLTGNGLRAV